MDYVDLIRIERGFLPDPNIGLLSTRSFDWPSQTQERLDPILLIGPYFSFVLKLNYPEVLIILYTGYMILVYIFIYILVSVIYNFTCASHGDWLLLAYFSVSSSCMRNENLCELQSFQTMKSQIKLTYLLRVLLPCRLCIWVSKETATAVEQYVWWYQRTIFSEPKCKCSAKFPQCNTPVYYNSYCHVAAAASQETIYKRLSRYSLPL